MRLALAYWRKYGVVPLTIVHVFGVLFSPAFVVGITTLVYLTIPCGISYFNGGWKWYLRQALFCILGVGLLTV